MNNDTPTKSLMDAEHAAFLILVAGPSEASVNEVERVIGGGRFNTCKVTCSRALVRTLRQQRVALAIVDTSLDDVEGHKLLGVLRELAPDVDVVVTTSRHTPELESEVRGREVRYYAIRPDEDAFLGEVVRAILQRRELRARGIAV